MRLGLYLSLFWQGMRSERRGFIPALMRGLFYLLVLVIFSRLWSLVSPGGFSLPQLLWYLALTELVTFLHPLVRLDIERDMADGTYAAMLQKPVNYPLMRACEAVGKLVARLPFMLLVGAGGAALLAGSVPTVLCTPAGIVVTCMLAVFAAMVETIFQCSIGLSAAFLRDCGPLHWVWQKFSFVLGGLMLPMVLYPEWIQRIAEWTPFYHILFGVGRIAVEDSLSSAWGTACALAGWGVVGVLLLVALNRRIESDVVGEGG